MPDTFESLDDFKRSLLEVDILCDAADSNQLDALKYTTFNKVALLLIAGKFEAFAESLIDEYIFLLNKRNVPCNRVSEVIRLSHTFRAFKDLSKLRHKHKRSEAILLFTSIAKLWGSQEPLHLAVDSSFAYGKHGSAELSKLFERIGIDDLFDRIVIMESIESVSTDSPVVTPVDFKGTFNSVCGMRNNILHEDDSPNLTSRDVKRHRIHFELFAEKLGDFLMTTLPNP
jgi:RiboL-PSP-HEPN